MRVAVCQVPLDADDPAGTWMAVTQAVDRAVAAGADLVVLPETTTTGLLADRHEATARAEPLTGPTVTRLRDLAERSRLVLVAGWCETSGLDRPYNSAVVIDRGTLVGHYRKTHLWDTEKLLFTPGSAAPPVVDTSVGRLGLTICYDIEIPEVVRLLAHRGAQIVVAPANWPLLPTPAGERPIEIAKAQAVAAQNRVFVAVADRCGTDRGQEWTGGSVVVDVTGYLLARAAPGRPDVVCVTLDPAAADDKRLGPFNDAFADLRPELYARDL